MSDEQKKKEGGGEDAPKLPFRQAFVWLLVLVALFSLVSLVSGGGALGKRRAVRS